MVFEEVFNDVVEPNLEFLHRVSTNRIFCTDNKVDEKVAFVLLNGKRHLISKLFTDTDYSYDLNDDVVNCVIKELQTCMYVTVMGTYICYMSEEFKKMFSTAGASYRRLSSFNTLILQSNYVVLGKYNMNTNTLKSTLIQY